MGAFVISKFCILLANLVSVDFSDVCSFDFSADCLWHFVNKLQVLNVLVGGYSAVYKGFQLSFQLSAL